MGQRPAEFDSLFTKPAKSAPKPADRSLDNQEFDVRSPEDAGPLRGAIDRFEDLDQAILDGVYAYISHSKRREQEKLEPFPLGCLQALTQRKTGPKLYVSLQHENFACRPMVLF